MSTIGIQSTANQRQSNGLSSRVPYDVGRSINACRRTLAMEMTMSMPNDASGSGSAPDDRSRRGGYRSSYQRGPIQTMTAVSAPRPTTPSGPCVGPRCHSRYLSAPPAVATMSTSAAFAEMRSAAVVPRPARESRVRASVTATSVCVTLSKCRNIPACETRSSRPLARMLSARDAVFDALLVSYQLVDPILKADSEPVAGKEGYDGSRHVRADARCHDPAHRRGDRRAAHALDAAARAARDAGPSIGSVRRAGDGDPRSHPGACEHASCALAGIRRRGARGVRRARRHPGPESDRLLLCVSGDRTLLLLARHAPGGAGRVGSAKRAGARRAGRSGRSAARGARLARRRDRGPTASAEPRRLFRSHGRPRAVIINALKLRALAHRLQCGLDGDGDVEIVRVAGITQAQPGDLTFVANTKYLSELATTRASAVILGRDNGAGTRPPCAVLHADDPYSAFAHAVALFMCPA